MPSRSNPYYRYQNPHLGMAFDGLAGALFPQPNKTASEIQAREAQAAANMALAAERDQNTRGKQIKNDRYAAPPSELAQLFLSGRLQDEPLTSNPLYEPPAPIDYGAVFRGEPIPQDVQPMMLGGRTAADQMAAALQQMEALGFRPDQVLQAVGRQQYLNQAMGDDPQSALALAPFVGVNPNANTALDMEAQDRISARNANESLRQATTVEGMRNQNRIEVEGMREDGRSTRGTGSGGSAASIPAVTPSTAKNMRESLDNRLKQMGYNNIEPQAIDEMLALSTRLFQDRDSDAFKNTALAVQEAVDMLEMGQVPGVSEVLGRSFFGGERRNLTRVPPSQRGAPAPAAALPDITTVPGIPAGARYGNRTAQGIEVLDRSGNLIGHIQE
jgi:hypothetical protein